MAVNIGLRNGARKMPKAKTGQMTGKSKVISSSTPNFIKAGGKKGSSGKGSVKAAKPC